MTSQDFSASDLDASLTRARDALLNLQHADGHWCFELESDATITAEYILMMHFVDEIDTALQARIGPMCCDHWLRSMFAKLNQLLGLACSMSGRPSCQNSGRLCRPRLFRSWNIRLMIPTELLLKPPRKRTQVHHNKLLPCPWLF